MHGRQPRLRESPPRTRGMRVGAIERCAQKERARVHFCVGADTSVHCGVKSQQAVAHTDVIHRGRPVHRHIVYFGVRERERDEWPIVLADVVGRRCRTHDTCKCRHEGPKLLGCTGEGFHRRRFISRRIHDILCRRCRCRSACIRRARLRILLRGTLHIVLFRSDTISLRLFLGLLFLFLPLLLLLLFPLSLLPLFFLLHLLCLFPSPLAFIRLKHLERYKGAFSVVISLLSLFIDDVHIPLKPRWIARRKRLECGHVLPRCLVDKVENRICIFLHRYPLAFPRHRSTAAPAMRTLGSRAMCPHFRRESLAERRDKIVEARFVFLEEFAVVAGHRIGANCRPTSTDIGADVLELLGPITLVAACWSTRLHALELAVPQGEQPAKEDGNFIILRRRRHNVKIIEKVVHDDIPFGVAKGMALARLALDAIRRLFEERAIIGLRAQKVLGLEIRGHPLGDIRSPPLRFVALVRNDRPSVEANVIIEWISDKGEQQHRAANVAFAVPFLDAQNV